MYIYSIWALNRGHYPYKWLWTYAGDKFFEAEGEIKFSPVYAHDLLLLKLKPAELLKTDTTANPISEKYIQDKKDEKKKGKIISSLVRNAKMTPTEAKAAVQVQDAPKQQRAGKGVLKFDRHLGN